MALVGLAAVLVWYGSYPSPPMPELFKPPARSPRRDASAPSPRTPPQPRTTTPTIAPPIEEVISGLPSVSRLVAEILLLRDPAEGTRYVRHIQRLGDRS